MDELEIKFLQAFHNASAKSAEDQADGFMEQNFAEAIYIQRGANWQIIKSSLTTAFKIAEARGIVTGRAEALEEAAKAYEYEADTWKAWPQAGAAKRKGAAAIRSLKDKQTQPIPEPPKE